MSLLPNILPVENDNFSFERQLRFKGHECIIGTDEAGRGPLAGPVVAACVSLPDNCDPTPFVDSKKTSLKQRTQLLQLLKDNQVPFGIGIVSHKRIDTINILQASFLAMKLAVYHYTRSHRPPDFILVDGKFEIPLPTPQQALVKGESKSASIAAASIVAKTKRDEVMMKLHKRFPIYSFNQHKGYPTKKHREAIAKYGPSPVHRLSFKGVREFVD